MARRNRNLCVKVARDVLDQLRLKRYKAIQGFYVQIEGVNIEEPLENGKESFKTFFKKQKQVSCNVCALGSCFVSLVNIKNECSMQDIAFSDTAQDLTFDRLEPLFGANNMNLMESAFECETMRNVNNEDWHEDFSDEMLEAASDWGQQWQDDNERLRQIMLNVIRNKGDFKLPKTFLAKVKRQEKANA